METIVETGSKRSEKLRTNMKFDDDVLGMMDELCQEERRSRNNLVNWLIEKEYERRHPDKKAVNGNGSNGHVSEA